MTMNGCYKSTDICAIRASILAPDGSPLYGEPDGSAWNKSQRSLGRSAITQTISGVNEETGCGDICYTEPDRTITTGETLTLQLCELDYELINILTGAEVITEGAVTIGLIAPDPSVSATPVEFHAWSNNKTNNAQVASPYTHKHWVWPWSEWSIGDWTLQRGLLAVIVTGVAKANANLGIGTFQDVVSPITQFFGVFDAEDIPVLGEAPYTVGCGWLDNPAS